MSCHFTLLTFNDLMEVRFVDRLFEFWIPTQRIRQGIKALREYVSARHPFTRDIVKTDGQSLFTKIQDEEGEHLFDLVKRNLAFEAVIQPLIDEMHYGPDAVVDWWTPILNTEEIIVYPKIAFGRPTVRGTRLESSLLADAVVAEGSIAVVAYLYEVREFLVTQAMNFERELAA